MAEPATRVALLARPGNACDRLQSALLDAGAQVVLVADPNQIDVGGIRTADAQAILIALEPSVEDALDRFDAVLGDPSITVIFDEAELAAQREGWDAARWVRHLAAKLNRHGDVLPPGAEAASGILHGVGMLDLNRPPDTDLDIAGLDISDLDTGRLDGGAVGMGALDVDAVDNGDLDIGDLAREFEALAAAMPEPGDAMQHVDGPVAAALPMTLAVGGENSTPARSGGDDDATNNRFRRDLDELQERIATMELVDAPRAISHRTGAVLVLAGIGGPDAVRQLLAALPAEFPRPVLIQQRLDGARHDKLVRQMQRATSMPVHLAAPGGALHRGHVYILPTDVGIGIQDNALRFQDGGDLFASLPADDSAVVLLSGSDPACLDAAMGLSWGGALVAGQTPDSCYDATAAEALIARGAEAGAPAEIGKRLATRWPA